MDSPRSVAAEALHRLLTEESQTALAGRINKRQSTLSRLASGKAQPSLAMAVDLEDSLGIPVRNWLRAAPKPARKRTRARAATATPTEQDAA